MKEKRKNFKKGSNSLNKLSLFQKNDNRFSKKCPLSTKKCTIIDYKGIFIRNILLIMVKFYHQKLHLFLLTNKKIN